IEASRALVKGACVACDGRVADLAHSKSGRACRRDMLCSHVDMMLDLNHLAASSEAAPMPRLDRGRVEVRHDESRALVSYPAQLGVGAIDFTQVAEDEAAPHHIEGSRRNRHVPNVAKHDLNSAEW